MTNCEQCFLQAAVETFHETVGLGMVGSGHDMFDAPDSSKLLEDGGLELSAPVRRDCCRNSELLYPAKCEGVDYRLRRGVNDGNSDRPARESVHGCQQVSEPIGNWHGYQVDVDMLETAVWNRKITNWRNNVLGHLGALALKTLSRPTTNIFTD